MNDRVVAIFGVPAAREDDALRAVRAACDLRAAGVVTRAVVATGSVITGDPSRGRPLVSGPPLQEADRLLAGAAEGDVLAGERTLRLVQHAVVPGAAPRSVERVLPDAEAVARRLETPLVGRADELGELFAAFQLATTTGQARLVTVLGPPGVGKTRLAREVVDVLAGTATCAVGKTPADGNAATYAPLRDAFSTLAAGRIGAWAAGVLAGQTDAGPVAERVAAACGETESLWPTEETAWAVRRLLETLARERPVVLVLEDLHDASPAMLDLVEHVATLARAPILLIVLARPELLDARPDWGGGMRGASILLDALPPERAAHLLDHLVARPVAPERRAAILGAAAGNPLFLEQLLASEDDDLSVPDSIHALLAARLDRLGEQERRVLQTAAVFGETFPTALVQSLVAADARQALLVLARRDFVEPAVSDPFGSESWAFRHALVRDETYATLPKLRRAQLHEQVAAVIESNTAEHGVDASEAIGNHLELAYRALHEVDPQAPELGRLARGAAQHLAAAGRRSVDERDMGTAAAFLQRAFDVVPPDAPERLDIAIRLADAFSWIDWREDGLRVLEEADRLAETADARERARVVVVRRALRLWGAEPENAAEALADVRQAIASLEEVGDHESLAYAYVLAYQAAVRLSSAEYQERDLVRAIEHARAAGVRALEGLATGWLSVELRHGSLPVKEAKRRMLEILDDPATQLTRAGALGGLADLRAMEGAFDEARALVAENHAIIVDLGMPQTEAADLIAVADVELQAGDLEAAERILRVAVDRLASLEAHYERAHAAWRLARVLVRQRRDAEARPFVSLANVERGGEFVGLWRTVLEATIAAREGESGAEALLERVDGDLERFTETGMLVDVILQTAEVSAQLGRPDDAAARLRRAAALAERLGYVVALREATSRLAEIEARL